MWELRSSKHDHKVAVEWCHQLTREKSEKSAYAKVKRLAAKYGLTIHNEGFHDGYWHHFDAWCESPSGYPWRMTSTTRTRAVSMAGTRC